MRLDLWRRFRSLGVYVALCVSCGVGAELFVESIGIGDKRGDEFWTVPHLALLGLLLAVAVTAALLCRSFWLLSASLRDCKRRLTLEVEALPCHRRAWASFALSMSIVLFGGLSAQLAEGSPALSQDAFAWLLAALIVALIAALAMRWCITALPRLVSALMSNRADLRGIGSARMLVRRPISGAGHRDIWSPPLFNRPPPAFQL